ncbi:MAG TPA: hypothetical protein VF459_12690 [Caulobacteraceae bacterium]
MELAKTLFAALSIPLALLNMFSGIVAGVWLLFLHRWADFGLGAATAFAGSYAVTILLIPTLALQAPGLALFNAHKPILGVPLIMAGALWTYAVMALWCLFMFSFFLWKGNGEHTILYLLWAYANAVGPWSYMASREQGESASMSTLSLFAAQVGCFAMMCGVLFLHADHTVVALSFYIVPFLLAVMLLQVALLLEAAGNMKGEDRGARVGAVFD